MRKCKKLILSNIFWKKITLVVDTPKNVGGEMRGTHSTPSRFWVFFFLSALDLEQVRYSNTHRQNTLFCPTNFASSASPPRETWEDCAGNAAVTFYTLEGGGHTWPGAPLSVTAGSSFVYINATDVIWDFFASHPRPPAP